MSLPEFYKTYSTVIYGITLATLLCIIAAGVMLLPHLFYDQWIWKYYWGPVVADATGHPVSWNGVSATEGYTMASEITYGLILIIALYALYKLLKKLQIPIDWTFCLALMPYILFGPVTRVLEDAHFFTEPFVYWFISPLIYFQIATYVLVFLFLGRYMKKISKKQSPKTILAYLLSIFVFVDVGYTIIWLFRIDYGTVVIHPIVFYLLSLCAFIPVLYQALKRTCTTNTVIFSGGLLFLLPSLYLIALWFTGDRWAFSNGVRFDVLALIVGLVTLIGGAVYLVSHTYRDNKKIGIYKKPLNLSLIVGHMIDGLTSYVSIYDPLNMGLLGYEEKHPASNILMETWPPLFPLVKFILIIVVIYMFDVLYKKELKHHQNLVNLIKISILVLGLSPGVRDLLRVTMGV
jgi:uncharacterized membrane protein